MIKQIPDYITLCKPKVVLMMLVTMWIGMRLSTVQAIPIHLWILATIGVGLCSSSAAVLNHLIDRKLDATMTRTQQRPLVRHTIHPWQALVFAIGLGCLGFFTLLIAVNPLTAYLTLAALFIYSLIYTIYLKRHTPQNIVIGGIAGAMPPLLGWSAVTNHIDPYAWLLVGIIFAWTPPHFWALAIARSEEYQKAKIPMLPVTHGIPFTSLFIVLYTLLLVIVTLLPYITHMSGLPYLTTALVLNVFFIYHVCKMYLNPSKKNATQTFSFSITYLLLLYGALLVDHWLRSQL